MPNIGAKIAQRVGADIGAGIAQQPGLSVGAKIAGVGQAPPPSAAAKKPSGGFGLGDWVKLGENLAVQGGEAIVGSGVALGKGALHVATQNPLTTVEGIPGAARHAASGVWSSTEQAMGPFVSGYKHLGKAGLLYAEGNHDAARKEFALYKRDRNIFNAQTEAQPLPVVLTLATAASFGTARLAALANLPEDATGAEVAAALARGHNAGIRVITSRATHDPESAVAVRTLPKNAARAGRMTAVDTALKKLPPTFPVVGEFARAGRATDTASSLVRHRLLAVPEFATYRQAFSRLNKWQRAAAQWRVKLPKETDLAAYVKQLRRGGSPAQLQTADILSDGRFIEEYRTPSPKTRTAIDAGRALAGKREQILASTGHDVADLSAAPARHIRVARGARFGDEVVGPVDVATPVGAHVRVVGKKTPARLIAVHPGEALPPVEPRLVPVRHDPVSNYSTPDLPISEFFGLMPKGNYLYHSTTPEALDAIRAKGLIPGKERTGEPTGVYLAEDGVSVHALRPGRRRPNDVILRVRRGDVSTKISDIYEPGSGYEEHYSTKTVPPNVIEYLGGDNQWHPLAPTATRTGPETATIYYPRYQRTAGGEGVESRPQIVHAADLEQINPQTLHGGGDPAEIIAEHAADPTVETPYYLPDQLDAKLSAKGTGKPTGLSPAGSDVRAWTGALMRAGTIATRPDVLSSSYLRSVVEAQAHDLHGRVIDAAMPVARGEAKPAGYVWVREIRGQQIPTGETYGAEHVQNVSHEFPELGDVSGDLTTNIDAQALEDNGVRFAVPEQFAKQMRAQQRASRGWAGKIWHQSTDVWRALVLNLRVPWLVNNIVGNHVLAALRFAGVAGLRAYVDALAEVRGIKAVRQLMGMSRAMGMSDEEMRQVFAEHTKPGTLIGSQLPGGLASKLPAGVERGLDVPGHIVGALPHLDRASEGFLRRVGVNTELRRSPEVRAAYNRMPRETRTWSAALAQAERTSGAGRDAIRNAVSREVNDALGNFLSLTHAEQNSIRSLVPFYAWYREITRIALKLPLDAPGRTLLVSQLGLAQPLQENYPSYLRGDVPVGKLDPQGRQTLLALRQMNPFTTIDDLGSAVASLLIHPTRRGAFATAGMANPFVGLLSDTVAKANAGDKQSQTVLQAFYNQFLLGLPEVRLGTNPQSRLYPGRTQRDIITQFLGDPRRPGYDPRIGASYAQAGQ